MPFNVKCRHCSKQFRLKDELNGKKFKCTQCGTIIRAIPLEETKPKSPSTVRSPRSAKPNTASSAPQSKSKRSSPANASGTSKKRSAASGSSARSASPRAQPSRNQPPKKKRQSNPYADDYRDASADELWDEPYDDYGDDYQDYDDDFGSDDTYDSPAPKRKSSSKKSNKSGGSRFGFSPNGWNIAMVFGGVVMFMLGVNESRLAGKSRPTPDNITLSELLANGNGGNIYLTISGIEPQNGEYVAETRDRANTRFSKVFIPCVPSNSNERSAKLVLFSTDASNDMEVQGLMNRRTHTGMIVNDIRGLGSDERNLLASNLGGTSPDSVLIFELGRTPSGAGARLMYFLGGAGLGLGGVAWILLGGGAGTKQTTRKVASLPQKRSSGRSSSVNPYSSKRSSRTTSLSIPEILFSFKGRIGIGTFWIWAIVNYAATNIVLFLIASAVGGFRFNTPAQLLTAASIALAVCSVNLWIAFALIVKRWQDRDSSGVVLFLLCVSVIGLAVVSMICLFFPGTPGENRYGPPPA